MAKYYVTKLSEDGNYKIEHLPKPQSALGQIMVSWDREAVREIVKDMEVGETRLLAEI